MCLQVARMIFVNVEQDGCHVIVVSVIQEPTMDLIANVSPLNSNCTCSVTKVGPNYYVHALPLSLLASYMRGNDE